MSVTVAYLGPAGTFTEAALWEFAHRGHLTTPVTNTKTMLDDATSGGGAGAEESAAAASPADNVIPFPCTSPREAISALRAGDADYAVVAIENSVDGFVTPTFDALDADGIQIYAELDLPIAFAMMMRPGMSLSEVTTVTTHPVAYQQVVAVRRADENAPWAQNLKKAFRSEAFRQALDQHFPGYVRPEGL